MREHQKGSIVRRGGHFFYGEGGALNLNSEAEHRDLAQPTGHLTVHPISRSSHG
jgi:hypothetical protein